MSKRLGMAQTMQDRAKKALRKWRAREEPSFRTFDVTVDFSLVVEVFQGFK